MGIHEINLGRHFPEVNPADKKKAEKEKAQKPSGGGGERVEISSTAKLVQNAAQTHEIKTAHQLILLVF